ncbi:MAG: hypothetical protein NC218_01405 [Acetobacter sp.]|nr:hypothetical protein [Acetobacter sp.]
MTLNDLLKSYGWQLLLVGLLGTFLVGFLKKPFHKLIYKDGEDSIQRTQTFDIVGFILGFVVAMALGCTYSALAQHFNWVENVESTAYNVAVYFSNGIGVWMYQLLFYQIWKKLGVKKVWEIIKTAVVKRFDKNKDGKLSIDEATATVLGMIKNGKISLDDVMSTVASVVPEIAIDVATKVQEQTEDVKVSPTDAIAQLDEITRQLLADIPEGKLSDFANSLVDKAAEKAKDIATNPATAPEPKRPTVKF